MSAKEIKKVAKNESTEKKNKLSRVIPPSSLTEAEAELYLLIYKDFKDKGIMSERYKDGIEMIAKLTAMERMLMKEIGSTSFYTTSSGQMKEHPASGQLHRTRLLLVTLYKEYGQTPAALDRIKKLSAAQGASEKDASPFSDL